MSLKPKFYLAGLFVFLIYAVIPAVFQSSQALALSADSAQHFDPSGSLTNWSITWGGPTAYFLSGTNSNATGDPLNGEPSPLTSGIANGTGTCPTCSVTITYTDPAPTGTQLYIEVDVFTKNIGRQFQIVVTDTLNNTATHNSLDLLYNCSGGGTLASSTIANTWTTLWVDTSGLANPVKTVQVIIPVGQADLMNTDQVFMDNLEGVGALPCLIPPTATNTPTATASNTATNTPTITPSNTPTNTSTNTDSPTPTATNSPTNTPSPTATKTPSNTPTTSPTNTFPATSTPTSPFTATNTPPNTPTNSPTPTFSNTATSTLTNSPTNTLTTTPPNTPTNTPTATATKTFTNSPTQTFTNTFTNTATNTPPNTATSTFTPTITPTPTYSFTPGPTATFTETLCPVSVYPNPMDFQASHAIAACPGKACIVIGCVPAGSTVNIYTVSLMLVRTFAPGDPNFTLASSSVGTIVWDGNNGDGNPVASGFYLYVIAGPNGRTFGKFAISRSRNAP